MIPAIRQTSKENIAADGETLIGCIYSAELFGEETEPSTVYDAEGKVSSVSIYLAGAEAGPYAERLTELYGEPDADSAGESTESGSSWEVWKLSLIHIWRLRLRFSGLRRYRALFQENRNKALSPEAA